EEADRLARGIDLIELASGGRDEAVGDVFHETGLEERTQRLGRDARRNVEPVFLPLVQEQKGILVDKVVPPPGAVEGRSRRHGLERSGRAVLLDLVAVVPGVAVENGAAVRQLSPAGSEAEVEGSHGV